MVYNVGPTNEAGIWHVRSWSENSQNYSKYSSILIKSIFHRNTQITKIFFLRIYLGTRVHNKFLNTRFIHTSKSQSETSKPHQTTQNNLLQIGCVRSANTFHSHNQSLTLKSQIRPIHPGSLATLNQTPRWRLFQPLLIFCTCATTTIVKST